VNIRLSSPGPDGMAESYARSVIGVLLTRLVRRRRERPRESRARLAIPASLNAAT